MDFFGCFYKYTVKPPLSGLPKYGHLPQPGGKLRRLYIVRKRKTGALLLLHMGPYDEQQLSFTMSKKSVGKKRYRRVVTLEKKLEIINQLKKVKSHRFVSSLFDIPKSTVADVWKAREKIERHVSASDNPSFAKKR